MNKSATRETASQHRRRDGCPDPAQARPSRTAGRGLPGADRTRQPRTLHQPRTVLARLQPPRGGGSREPAPSAAGAAALRLDQRLQPRRVLFRARRRADRPGQGRRHRRSRRTAAPRRSSSPRSSSVPRPCWPSSSACWRELRGLLREAGIEVCEPDELSAEDVAAGSTPGSWSACSRS